MRMKKYVWVALIVPLLFACSSNQENAPIVKDTKALDILTGQFSHNIDQIWGLNEVLVASRQDYVKYTDNYLTRSHINFSEGKITIGTLGNAQQLRRAIVHTLLMGSNADGIDLFASGDVPISKTPLLRNLVMNENGKPVDTVASANAFALYLIKHKLQTKVLSNGHKVRFVQIPMVANHIALRAQQFLPLVRKAARRYHIDETLILGIMETESTFNPYARSSSNAVGLMQIITTTAGQDVFKHRGWRGRPTHRYLLNPANNIDVGTAYLALLKNKYLKGIKDPESMRYAIISSYNSGAGAVLRMFASQPQVAIEKINQLTPSQFYHKLEREHPSAQARRYLQKVTKAQKNYRIVHK